MNDMSSLPPLRSDQMDAMLKNVEKKFGKVPGLEEYERANPNPVAIQPAILAVHAEPEIEQPQQETLEPTPVAEHIEEPQEEVVVQQVQPEPEQARNFRAIREKAERAERERDEAMKLVRELSAAQANYHQPKLQAQPQQEEEVDTFGMNPDDLVEGKHLGKVSKEIRALKAQLKEYQDQARQGQEQARMTATEARLKAQYPDFDNVVNTENLTTFSYAYPELAHTLKSTQDVYAQAVSAYTMIKKFGIGQQEPLHIEKELAKKNIAKPRPVTSIAPQQGDTPLSRANAFANGLTSDLQAQLRKEMMEARKGY